MRGIPIARLIKLIGFCGLVLWGVCASSVNAQAQTSSSVRPPVVVEASPTDGTVPGAVQGNTSDAEMWRSVNHGNVGYVSIPDKQAGLMINRAGELWRTVRAGPVLLWGGVLIGGSLLSVIGFGLVYGKFKLHSARTGRVIPRFSQGERWVHWFVAGLFMILGLTGLVILFGRPILKPVIGAEGLGIVANASLQAHNLLGPIFVVALAIMLVMYFKDNVYQKGDFAWAMKGGFFSRHHPPSWKYNLGEKSWYWLLVFAGTAISVSGVVLIFPSLPGDLQSLQLAQIVHVICAIALITASLGHIYLGVWGVEGALDSMTLGYVDETWGLEHHRWWAEDEIGKHHNVEGAPSAVLAAHTAEAS